MQNERLKSVKTRRSYDAEFEQEMIRMLVSGRSARALLKAIRFIDHYEPGTNAKVWITQVMRNLFLNDCCAHSKVCLLPLLGYPLEADSDRTEHLAVSSNLEQEITANAFSDELTHALGILSRDLGLIVLFTDANDPSFDATADPREL